MDVEEALRRLRDTAVWRRDWQILQYYSQVCKFKNKSYHITIILLPGWQIL
jgi:hypothetical protein